MPSHCCGMCQSDDNFISSTISSTSSPLLRLPQELKDRIYQFVYGGFHIRVSAKYYCVDPCLELRMHAYKHTHHDELGIFCCEDRHSLPVASLGTCRQLYHEAKNVLYSANDFALCDPKLVGLFVRRLDDVNHCSLAVRSMQLHVFVSSKNNEREWDNTFRALAEGLKNLRQIRIIVSPRIWNRFYHTSPLLKSPTQRKGTFLQGLLELKNLPLKTVKLVVEEDLRVHGTENVWTVSQRQEWAQKMEGAILGSG